MFANPAKHFQGASRPIKERHCESMFLLLLNLYHTIAKS